MHYSNNGNIVIYDSSSHNRNRSYMLSITIVTNTTITNSNYV